MGGRDKWRESEERVITVTLVSRGVARPFLITLTTIALIVESAARFHLVHRYEGWLVLVLAGPVALLTLTRTWHWRSHKVHLTSERVVIEGGALRRQRTSIEMRDVVATHVQQRVSERLTRRGVVILETRAGPVTVGLVRHPEALCRLIDAQRSGALDRMVSLDTVFTYEEPDPFQLQIRPEAWPRRRHE